MTILLIVNKMVLVTPTKRKKGACAMKSGNHVRYDNGKKVHFLVVDEKYVWAKCDSGLWNPTSNKFTCQPLFHPTTDPIDCKKCLKFLKGKEK